MSTQVQNTNLEERAKQLILNKLPQIASKLLERWESGETVVYNVREAREEALTSAIARLKLGLVRESSTIYGAKALLRQGWAENEISVYSADVTNWNFVGVKLVTPNGAKEDVIIDLTPEEKMVKEEYEEYVRELEKVKALVKEATKRREELRKKKEQEEELEKLKKDVERYREKVEELENRIDELETRVKSLVEFLSEKDLLDEFAEWVVRKEMEDRKEEVLDDLNEYLDEY